MSLADCYSADALTYIRNVVRRCESLGVDLLCCPEGAIGGLADYVANPMAIAMRQGSDDLARMAESVGSTSVTTIVGFTEVDDDNRLFNSAAIIQHGVILGVYRKRHPAINRSVYSAGEALPVFTVSNVTFGILICRDSTFANDSRDLAALGARMLFVPTNNGLPPAKGGAELVDDARNGDERIARANAMSVIRADVAGYLPAMAAHGSSGIFDHNGKLLSSARLLTEDLIVADV